MLKDQLDSNKIKVIVLLKSYESILCSTINALDIGGESKIINKSLLEVLKIHQNQIKAELNDEILRFDKVVGLQKFPSIQKERISLFKPEFDAFLKNCETYQDEKELKSVLEIATALESMLSYDIIEKIKELNKAAALNVKMRLEKPGLHAKNESIFEKKIIEKINEITLMMGKRIESIPKGMGGDNLIQIKQSKGNFKS